MQNDTVQAQIAAAGNSDSESVEPALEVVKLTPTNAAEDTIPRAAVCSLAIAVRMVGMVGMVGMLC
jgi:hypothetical protein